MPEPIHIAKTEPPPERGGFVTTPTARKINGALGLITALPGSQMTMVCGAPGIGKSETVRHFQRENRDVLIFTASGNGEGTGRDREPAELLAEHFRLAHECQSIAAIRRALRSHARLSDVTIIFDEANNLSGRGMEWLRIVCEEGGANLALVGDLNLASKVARLPQLLDRVRPFLILKKVVHNDVQEIAASYGIASQQALKVLDQVAQKQAATGGLRSVVKVLQLADIFANGEAITVAHIKSACANMNLNPEGDLK